MSANYDCSTCKKQIDNKKIFFKNQLYSACLECLRIKLEKVLELRAINLKKDLFCSRECKKFILNF